MVNRDTGNMQRSFTLRSVVQIPDSGLSIDPLALYPLLTQLLVAHGLMRVLHAHFYVDTSVLENSPVIPFCDVLFLQDL